MMLKSAAVIFILIEVARSNTQCDYDDSNNDNTRVCSSACQCDCQDRIMCLQGPPRKLTGAIDLEVYLVGLDPLADNVKYIDQGWSSNMGYFDGEENWSYLELRWGKYDPVGRQNRQLTGVNVHVSIAQFANLQYIKSDAFDDVARVLVSLEVVDCPLLHTIEPRQDFPTPGLAKLTDLDFIRLASLETADFLNSQFWNWKNSLYKRDANHTINVRLKSNPELRSLGLTRPLSLGSDAQIVRFYKPSGSDAMMALELSDNPKLDSGFDVCFLKGKILTISMCGMSCRSCERAWLAALNSEANQGSKHNDWNAIGYPWLKNRTTDDWFWFDATPCNDAPKCTEPEYKDNASYDFTNWPLPLFGDDDFVISTDKPPLTPMSAKCNFGGKYDPFMVFHDCFKSANGWTSCLEGCDCSNTTMHCVHGPHYDEAQRMIIVSHEDLPDLVTMDKSAFAYTPEEHLEVETFYIYNNPTLSAITADVRMFDNETVKNVIISKNPRLTRVAEFISPYWMNLEYLEMSYMGVAFGQNAREILQDIFRYYRTKLLVLDLTGSRITSFPSLNHIQGSYNLRYLILEGNLLQSIDMETFMSFYILNATVETIPPMLIKRTPSYRPPYKKMKTLNLLNLSELKCDCRMKLEHIARVQDPIYWDPRILNHIMIGDICIPNPTTTVGCRVHFDQLTGCSAYEYKNGTIAFDLPCRNRNYAVEVYNASTKAESGVACTPTPGVATYCTEGSTNARDYSYFYCDQNTARCKPAPTADPVIPYLRCSANGTNTCFIFQNLHLRCPGRQHFIFGCSVQLLECNTHIGRCQFKWPHRKTDYKANMCQSRIARLTVANQPYSAKQVTDAARTWLGDCGQLCVQPGACDRWSFALQQQYYFCCTNDGYCATECYNRCPAGRTGVHCEAPITFEQFKCPTGWGGVVCQIKLCNKFFECQNGAQCIQSRCECKEGFFGADCSKHQICSDNPCQKPHLRFCKASDANNYICMPASRILTKYRFADDSSAAMEGGVCDADKCSEVLSGSICYGNRCGCPLGYVARKPIGQAHECVVGAAPCDQENYGECATIHEAMVCSGNDDYIMKVSQRPVAYRSYCLCSLPQFFHTVTGACLLEKNETADAEFLRGADQPLMMSSALIGIICLAVIGVVAIAGAVLVVHDSKQSLARAVERKKAKTSVLAGQTSRVSVRRGQSATSVIEEKINPPKPKISEPIKKTTLQTSVSELIKITAPKSKLSGKTAFQSVIDSDYGSVMMGSSALEVKTSKSKSD